MYGMSKQERTESLKILKCGLGRYRGHALRVNGRIVFVEDIIEQLDEHIEQIERTEAAHAMWLEHAASERDDFRGEISPLLAVLRMFIASMFGPCSPRMREFGFEPVQQANGEAAREVPTAVGVSTSERA